MKSNEQVYRELVDESKARLKRLNRHVDSLEAKLDQLSERSPQVRRYVAMKYVYDREVKAIERQERDLAHWVMALDVAENAR